MPCAALSTPPVNASAIALPKGVWVIYREPVAGSDRYVARKFLCGAVFTFTTDDELSADTLDELRPLLPSGLENVGRHESDPASVVEIWC